MKTTDNLSEQTTAASRHGHGAWLALATLLIMLLTASCNVRETLREGDLLFCISADGNAITDVTQGIDGRRIDHVAIVHYERERCLALEATHRGVALNPMDSFMVQRKNRVVAARLIDTTGVAASVKRALGYVGRPYDFFFMPGDSALYCSELVQLTYRDGTGRLVFDPIPMSFHDQSGNITPYWTRYYESHGLSVPEGKPGSNPGDLSRSPRLRLFKHKFRYP